MNKGHRPIVILDFGGQYTHLIARRIRSLGVYAEIKPYNALQADIQALNPIALILSGGPHSVILPDAPKPAWNIFAIKDVPILGICYGMQYIISSLGGQIEYSKKREYGKTIVKSSEDYASALFANTPKQQVVWMSHGDSVKKLPDGFICTYRSLDNIAACEDPKRSIYALQFHPEVVHSEHGQTLLKAFVEKIVRAPLNWQMGGVLQEKLAFVKKKTRDNQVVLALSGGVDSTVLAMLLAKAIPNQVQPIFVDNGLLRQGEKEKITHLFRERLRIPLTVVDASEQFLSRLRGVTDPEKKRQVIGKTFVDVFFPYLEPNHLLAQGTLYTDVIESINTTGPSDKIKTHHNRVSEILKLEQEGRLLEPFTDLFKDEVRQLGEELRLDTDVIYRHPFPGPGLAVRVLGEVTASRLGLLRAVDKIFLEELKRFGHYQQAWQSFSVLLDSNSVGVVGDKRTYGAVVALRSVVATDGMTADFSWYEKDFLALVANRIIGEVKGIVRVVYDITSKPPATIEWE